MFQKKLRQMTRNIGKLSVKKCEIRITANIKTNKTDPDCNVDNLLSTYLNRPQHLRD